MSRYDRAKLFFEGCETGKGWQVCKQFCHPNATFTCQSDAIGGIKSLEEYTNWMQGLFAIMPDASYTLLCFAEDKQKNAVSACALFKGTHTGQKGPGGLEPTGKQTNSHYTYIMNFDGDKITSMIKIWNNNEAFKQLGWV